MYEKFYNFSGKPFQLNPDPRFFYRSRSHQRAMAYLRYGIQQGQGFIVITGDVGTGKTMLVTNLFKDLRKHNIVACKIVSTNVGEHDLLRLIAADFELGYEDANKAILLKKLEEYFRACLQEGKRVLLVVDEAQNLPHSSIEEMRMLSNFEYKGQPLLQSFLLGQREFRATMRSQGFEQLRQRVIAAYHLRPLSLNESRAYVEHRLKVVGWDNDPVIEDGAFAGIYKFTGGVPRRINTLCDRLLLNGCLDEVHEITEGELKRVTDELGMEYGDPDDDDEPEAYEETPATPDLDETPSEGLSERDVGVVSRATRTREIEELEQKLGAMQSAVESLNRTVKLAAMNQAAAPRPPEPESRPEREPGNRGWTIGIGVAVAAVLIVGIGLYFAMAG